MQEKTSNRWTKKQTEYLLSNYRKKTLKDIAVDLEKTEAAVYNKAQTLGIVKKRRWTEKEDYYLEDNLGKMELRNIAKQLFRTVPAVLGRMNYLNLKSTDEDELTLKNVCKSVGISEFLVYSAIKEGKLKTLGRKIDKNKTHIFDIHDFRDFILKNHHHKRMKCFECSEKCVGDIYCEKHIGAGMKRPEKKIKSFIVHLKDKDTPWKIGEAFREIRLTQNINQEHASIQMNHNKLWYGYIERGAKQTITLDDLRAVAEGIGCEIILEIRPLDKRQN